MTQNSKSSPGLTYRDAGVDIDAGESLVERIKADVASTKRPGVLGGLGGFGGLFELPVDRYRQPVLVSGTDGVGTKLKLAIATGQHQGIGIDLVAMCANDVLVQGAEPLFFLDYYATGKLDVEVAAAVVSSIAEGCRQAGCALLGGETAEMPGMYAAGHYDLAGFCVGIVEKAAIIDGSQVQAGDVLIGIASSGLHSNGYSLARKVVDVSGRSLDDLLDERTLAEHLLAPTRIYVRPIQKLLAEVQVKALAHITGGGLPENLPRVLPQGLTARIDTTSWEWPRIFQWLQQQGQVENAEMYRTFNCGVGMVAVVAADAAERTISLLQDAGEQAWRLGEMLAAEADQPAVILEA